MREIFDPDEERELRSPKEVRKDRHQIMDMIQASDSDLVVKLGAVDMNLEKVMSLVEGDLINLPQPTGRPLMVEMEGKPLFLGEAGHVHQQRAIRLTERVGEE